LLLTLDIGNSQTAFGCFEGEKLVGSWSLQTRAARASDEYAAFLLPLLAHAGLAGSRWNGVAVASVVPAANHAVERFARDYLGVEPFHVRHDVELGCRLAPENPGEVGADRLANAAYAARWLSLPCVVIDIGTATTLDVIDADRVYRGGAILPGPRLAMDALGQYTAKLPVAGLELPARGIGRNTLEAIRAGVLLGGAAAVNGLVARMTRELGGPVEVALTGGFSSLFREALDMPVRWLPSLTLEGIALVYRLNSR